MKRSNFNIVCYNDDCTGLEAKPVTGYVFTLNSGLVGVHKSTATKWTVTDLDTGSALFTGNTINNAMREAKKHVSAVLDRKPKMIAAYNRRGFDILALAGNREKNFDGAIYYYCG